MCVCVCELGAAPLGLLRALQGFRVRRGEFREVSAAVNTCMKVTGPCLVILPTMLCLH